MKQHTLILFLAIALSPILGFSQNESFSFLASSTTGDIVVHSYYTLSYDEEHEQAEWVAYRLTSEMINGSTKRFDYFRADPKIETQSAQLYDYKGSGYDRGHLAPAADMKLNSTAMSESFFLSNMSPQEASFNRGAWKKLEQRVRDWALDKGDLYVVTGGILSSEKTKIGKNNVTVPEYYYKVLFFQNGTKTEVLAFYMPNRKCDKPLDSYLVTVDFIESKTGIDFFAFLSEDTENRIESSVDKSGWFSTNTMHINATENKTKVSSKTSSKPVSTTVSKRSIAVRCSAITQKGTQCKRRTKNINGRCWQHQ